MTYTKATRIVAEAIGLEKHAGLFIHPDQSESNLYGLWFDPCNNANDEQFLLEWARENLTVLEQIRASNYAATERAKRGNDMAKKHDKLVAAEMMSEIGDLTRAVARVLAERSE